MRLPSTFRTEVFPVSSFESPLGQLTLAGASRNSLGPGFAEVRRLNMWALVLSLAGRARFRDGEGLERDLAEGDLLAMPPNLPHAYAPAPGHRWHEVYLCFRGVAFDQYDQSGWFDGANRITTVRPVAYWLRRFLEIVRPGRRPALAGGDGPAARILAVHGLMHDLVAARDPHVAGDGWDGRLTLAKRLLDAALTDPRPDLPRLAQRCGLSYESLRKRFRIETGRSLRQYHTEQRMAAAQRLLERSRMTLSEAAAALGYCDEFHLSKTFKRVFGHAPRRRAPD